MKTVLSMLIAFAVGGCYATVGEERRGSGGEAGFTLRFPDLMPLVVVQPGVSVARDRDDEVFYSDGYYWVRQDRTWYRSHDHRQGWARVDDGGVPQAIVQSPPGRYRHYQGDERRGDDQEHGKRDGHEGDHHD